MEQNFTLDQIQEVVTAAWAEGRDIPIWAFYAPMGTGKTTFIHALCTMLGVRDAVSSPTFALVNEYQYEGGHLFHMDWYRLGSLEEAIRACIDEHLHSGDTCLIEWPENVPDLLEGPVFEIRLSRIDEQTRHIYSSVKS
ncbi:MAG: tRNA (adenosine(37)-N6)-threonylcarbamoyltransferase complex ATPase subunit type 1 TsaE [Sediminibacterium sp.]